MTEKTEQRGMLVSVVVPLFNKANFVETMAMSVLQQSYSNFELLIVNDGSTDDSSARLHTAFADPRLRILQQTNAGPGAARNRAMRESRGSIIAFVDADDEWFTTHLSDIVDLARRFPEAGLLATRCAYRVSGELRVVHSIQNESPCLIESYFTASCRPGAFFVHSSSCAIPRQVYENCGEFLESIASGEDQEYWARICLKYSLAYHPRLSAIYRLSVPGSVMSRLSWTPDPPVVVPMLKRYLANHVDGAGKRGVRDYACWILLNHAASGIKSGANDKAAQLLADPLVASGPFKLRRWILRLGALMPARLSQLFLRFHALPLAAPWRWIYQGLNATGWADRLSSVYQKLLRA